jgi:hypothetical protein
MFQEVETAMTLRRLTVVVQEDGTKWISAKIAGNTHHSNHYARNYIFHPVCRTWHRVHNLELKKKIKIVIK